MNDLLPRLERWNEEDKYQEIIDAIEALPEGELNFTLISALARAYNNLAIDVMPPEDRPLYQRALDLLLPLEDQLEAAVKEDPDAAHTWNFRVAYAYYYLNQESLALPYFEKALEGRPGDEDTLEFIDRCQQGPDPAPECEALPGTDPGGLDRLPGGGGRAAGSDGPGGPGCSWPGAGGPVQ